MQRIVPGGYAEVIGEALAIIPLGIADRLRHVQFLTGSSPHWVGLHDYDETVDGRLYAETMHCCYPWHTSDGSTTIVIPQLYDVDDIVHELGHALDGVLGFEFDAQPVTEWALTDREEAFAESFKATYYLYGDQDVWMQDLPIRDLLTRLAETPI